MSHLSEKQALVADLTQKFEESKATVIVDYLGINAKQTTELRKTLRENDVTYVVAKNTLFKRAAEAAGQEGLEDYFQGVTAVAFSPDEVAAANLITKFIKDNKILTVKGGSLEGVAIDAAKVNVLGSLPSREGLLSQVASVFKAPLQNVCYAFEALRKKEAGEDDAEATA